MRVRFYSSARAALTGGDGMVDVGPMPSVMLASSPTARAFLERFAEAVAVSYEEFAASLDRNWFLMCLGYDPQLLLPAPSRPRCPLCHDRGYFLERFSDNFFTPCSCPASIRGARPVT